jgi:hypothetical protein
VLPGWKKALPELVSYNCFIELMPWSLMGQILAFALTEGNVDERKPVSEMAKGLFSKLFGDRGYVS